MPSIPPLYRSQLCPQHCWQKPLFEDLKGWKSHSLSWHSFNSFMIFLDVLLHVSSLQFDTMVLLFTLDKRQFNFLSFTIIFSVVEDYYQVSAKLWFPHPAWWLFLLPLSSCHFIGKRECPRWTQHLSWSFINQGIIEWPGCLKGTLKINLFQPSCCR